jgi:hypothetical protein
MPQETDTQHTNPPTGPARPSGEVSEELVSEELVRKVTDRVYALLLAELRLDFERQRATGLGARRRGGW